VVGAGAVGLACAYALSRRGLFVAVLEAESAIGQGVSSRNSEVVHGGLYYRTGSLKARLCTAGRRALYAFLEAHNVRHARCGKLVVAAGPGEAERVKALFRQAEANGVENVRLLTAAEVRALEPELTVEMGLLSPESGIFDSHGYMLALQGAIEARGGVVIVSTPFEGARALESGGFRVAAGGVEPTVLTARLLVTAPGLFAQAVAGRIEAYPAAAIPPGHYGKGVYFRLAGKAPFQRLVYPPPVPGALGIHYRRDLGGQAVFGPDLTYVETLDYSVDPAAAPRFYASIRKYWPGLPDGALLPDYAGIRPKIHGPNEPQPDYRIDGAEVHGLPGLVTLFGIESPGLTCSLALGDEVAARLGFPP
jgi:L-2-hydroxyglutarate oxidase LhgO